MEFGQKSLGRPAFFNEEIFHAGALAAFAQTLLVAENFGYAANDSDGLVGKNKSVQPHGDMRLPRESAADAKRVANLAVMLYRGKANVVDLRIAAPRGAAGDRDFELARQVIELRIPGEQLRDLTGQGRGVNQFVAGDSGKWTARDVAHYVAAGA